MKVFKKIFIFNCAWAFFCLMVHAELLLPEWDVLGQNESLIKKLVLKPDQKGVFNINSNEGMVLIGFRSNITKNTLEENIVLTNTNAKEELSKIDIFKNCIELKKKGSNEEVMFGFEEVEALFSVDEGEVSLEISNRLKSEVEVLVYSKSIKTVMASSGVMDSIDNAKAIYIVSSSLLDDKTIEWRVEEVLKISSGLTVAYSVGEVCGIQESTIDSSGFQASRDLKIYVDDKGIRSVNFAIRKDGIIQGEISIDEIKRKLNENESGRFWLVLIVSISICSTLFFVFRKRLNGFKS